jgi:XTP/dITP diphosphohydrolase
VAVMKKEGISGYYAMIWAMHIHFRRLPRDRALQGRGFYAIVRPPMEIVLATRNKKKVEEIRRITADLPITVLSLDDFPDCPETVEDRDSFEANAIKKAVEVAMCTGKISLADDSGLEVDALGGAPGVYSARYAPDATSGNDPKNYEKLLKDLKNIPPQERSARFVCSLAIAYPDGRTRTFFGCSRGRIGFEPRGKKGFGYDPVFFPEGFDRTFAEMTAKEKDLLSHRGKAVEKLAEFLHSFSKHKEN